MARDSQSEFKNDFEIIESQIRENFGRVVYSHKTQEKCADIAFRLHKRLKLAQIILSATVATSIIVKVFGESTIPLYVAAILSTLLFGLNMYMKDYDLGELTQKHANAANELWDIRESYTSLIADSKTGLITINQLIAKRDILQQRLLNVYSAAPRTFSKAYNEASKALKINEELTFSDSEIDHFLPINLRKTNNE